MWLYWGSIKLLTIRSKPANPIYLPNEYSLFKFVYPHESHSEYSHNHV